MININNSWDEFFTAETQKPYFHKLYEFLDNEFASKKIYPPKELIFSAYKSVPIEKVKVVVLGQDPYHGANQAHGMAFSVLPGVKLPPSLVNIFKEVNTDIGGDMPSSGYLIPWASQGVFMLNACLTVEENRANSHKGIGWERFTDETISLLNRHENPKVFMLWGNPAKAKKKLITNEKHLVLGAAHPSPLSAWNGFFGCKHFSKANEFLIQNGIEPIDWSM